MSAVYIQDPRCFKDMSQKHIPTYFSVREESKTTSKWGWVKTVYPCSEHQNSWDLWM